ncbi:MAG: HlyD family efflux transporter periplasmic adaptor subunit [Luteitalea sp.]|nr:HlyD family efflux transporter periplasmic adaptor subunit [Luteitalea sp.]
MVDIARPPEVIRRRKIRRIIYGVIALAAVLLITVAVSRLKPAAPPVERGTVWIQEVTRGRMVRNVRGTGTLVPLDISWVAAPYAGRIDRVLLRPGVNVKPDTVVVELSNPELTQAVDEAQLALEGAEAALAKARADLRGTLLTQQATIADVDGRSQTANAQAKGYQSLHKEGLVSDVQALEYTSAAKGLSAQLEAERRRLAITKETEADQLGQQEAEVKRLRTIYVLRRQQLDNLRVRAGVDGVLQAFARVTTTDSSTVEIQRGTQVLQGANLFRVADPRRLKAELRIPETQVRDVEIGQQAEVDTRNGIVKGVVSGVAGAAQEGTVTIDVSLEGDLPRGARPNLTVDGTITLERLPDVVKVGRPAFGQEGGSIQLFKLLAKRPVQTGDAVRTTVQIGRSSVNEVEVLDGLQPGDQVILSDMTQFDDADRVRVVN